MLVHQDVINERELVPTTLTEFAKGRDDTTFDPTLILNWHVILTRLRIDCQMWCRLRINFRDRLIFL